MKKTTILALLVIGLAMCFTMWAFSSALTPYVDIRTARKSDTPVQVKGKILHDTTVYDGKTGTLQFDIEDANKDHLHIVYKGAKPDSFDTAPETAADGVVEKDVTGKEVFVSTKMVVKCPSKYDDSGKAPGPVQRTAAAQGSNT